MSLQDVIELIVVFIFRASIAFYFTYFQIYFCELYPSRARGIGSGVVSCFGTIASTSSPLYLGLLKSINFNVMTVFVLWSIIGISCVLLLKESMGIPLR